MYATRDKDEARVLELERKGCNILKQDENVEQEHTKTALKIINGLEEGRTCIIIQRRKMCRTRQRCCYQIVNIIHKLLGLFRHM